MWFLNAGCFLYLLSKSKYARFSKDTNSAACLPLWLLLFIPTGHVLRVESPVESVEATDRSFGNAHVESLSPADQELLDGNLMSEPYQIVDRILRKQVAAKRSKLLTRTILCNCLRSSFYCAGASIPRTAFWVVSSVVRIQ